MIKVKHLFLFCWTRKQEKILLLWDFLKNILKIFGVMIRNISKLFFKWKIKTFLNISFPFSPYFLAETSLQIEKEKKKNQLQYLILFSLR